jgi:hypothetical protein
LYDSAFVNSGAFRVAIPPANDVTQ